MEIATKSHSLARHSLARHSLARDSTNAEIWKRHEISRGERGLCGNRSLATLFTLG
jgi:hypothetical protein